MKKQKPQLASPEQKVSAENELAVLFIENKNVSWIIQQVSQKLAKSRSEIMVYIVANDANELLSNTDITDMQQKGKCIIGNIEAVKEAILNGKASWLLVADESNDYMLNQAISFFSSNKKGFTEKHIYTGIKGKESGGEKAGLVQNAKVIFYNFVGQLVTPTPQKDLTLPFQYFPKNILAELLHPLHKTAQDLLGAASYQDFPFNQVIVTSKELGSRSMHWGRLFSNAWKMRINSLVKQPLADRKNLWKPAFFVFTVFALMSMLVWSQQFGMTWDEKRHNEYSKESLKYFETFGEDTTCLSENLPTQEFRYYGEHFNVIAAFLYTHISPLGEYETRHLLNALYGFLAMLFAALLAKEIGSWRTATIAFVMIYLSPVFFGHSMNNPTDIPFACGFSMAIYYLFKIFRTMPSPKGAHIFLAAVGVGIAVGSRVGGVLLYAYAGMFFGIHFLLQFKKDGFKYIRKYVRVFVLLVVIGHLCSVSLWPFGQQHILTNWYEALKKSTEGAYFTYNHELFEGVRMYMANVPWYYLPKFILINTPLMVLVGFGLALVTLLFLRRIFSQPVLVWFVLFTLVFPIVYAEYQSMYYYNGWRHYLFVYPPLIILSALGWEGIMRLLPKPVIQKTALVLLLGLSLLPASWMVANSPNQCVYFNEIAGGTKGAFGKYETDYYSNSCRAAAEWLAKQEPNRKILVAINNEPQTAAYYATKINPNMEFKWVREYEEQKPFWDYAIFTSRTYSKKEIELGSFPPKGTIHVIEADGVPLAAVVKREDYNMPLGYQASEKKNYDSAVYYFTLATQYNPNDEEAWRVLGEAYMNKGSGDTAIMMLQKSLEIAPESYSAYSNLGMAYMNLKHDDVMALKSFDKSIALKYNFAEGYYFAASVYMARKDYNRAITYMENAVKRGGNGIPEIYYNLGVCYLYTGLNKKAEENFINCLTLSPNFAMGYRALAEAFSKQGKNNEAQQCMQKYQQLGGQ